MDLDITNVNDLPVPSTTNEAYDDFAAMWAEEAKAPRPDHSMGLEDTYEDSDVGFDQIDDDGYDAYDREISEHAKEVADAKMMQSMEEVQVFADNFSELPKETVVTTSTGQQISIGDIEHLINNNETVKMVHSSLAGFNNEMAAMEAFMTERALTLRTDDELTISRIDRELANPYLTDHERGAYGRERQDAVNRINQVNAVVHEQKMRIEGAKVEALKQRMAEMNTTMSRKYPNWESSKESVFSYVKEYGGMTHQDIASVLNSGLAEMAYKSMMWDNNNKQVQKAVEKTLNTPKQSSISSSQKKTIIKTPPKSDALARFEKGQADDKDVSSLFSILED